MRAVSRHLPDQFEDRYLSGQLLYGDDLVGDDLAAWFGDEAEGYAMLGPSTLDPAYGYEALNRRHGFDHLPPGTFHNVLGFGSARGAEFRPLVNRIERLVIVEPSRQLRSTTIGPLSPTYVDPSIDGHLDFADDSFDLITCFGVLHHVPNVSAVLGELTRCLSPGGSMLLREPIISMGDWRYARKPGITRRERGLPLAWLRDKVASLGLTIQRETLCDFSLSVRMGRVMGRTAYDDKFLTRLDEIASQLTSWNSHRYHCTKLWHKVRPRSVFLVLTK